MLPFLTALLFSSVPVVSAPSQLAETVVRFNPVTIEFGPEYCVGESFTIVAKIDDVAELCAFDLRMKWNTAYLDYVGHTMMVPVEHNLGGILHGPVFIVVDSVNETQGTYDCVVSTLGGAPFYGSGTAFEITLSLIQQPKAPEPDVHFQVRFTDHILADPYAGPPIYHSLQNCDVTIHANPQLVLSVDSLPSGASFRVEDRSYTAPWSCLYGLGCSAYVVMPETWIHDGITYLWGSWSDGYEYRIRIVPMMNDTTLIAIYKTSPPVGGTSVTIDFGKFSSWITTTLLLASAVITLNVKWNRRRRKP